MGRILSESLGTFLLVTAFIVGNNLAAAAAYAVALWALAAAPTGAFNPIATLALGIRGKLAAKWVVALIGTQLLSALAAAVFTGLAGGYDASRLAQEATGLLPPTWFRTLVAEGLGTAALILLLLVALAARRTAGSTLAPLMAGLGLFALLEALRGFGAFMNPSLLLAWGFHDLMSAFRSEAPAPTLATEALRFGAFVPWALVVVTAQVAGGLVGVLLFRLTHPAEAGD